MWAVLEVGKDETGKNTYRVCETVTMIPGGEGIRKPKAAEETGKIHMAV